jgi:hypothetical protein
MNIINVLMIIFIIVHFISFFKRATKEIMNCKDKNQILGVLIGCVLHVAIMIYAVFFYHWH